MEEMWKCVDGFESKYEVSSQGNVRSLDRIVKNGKNSERYLKGRILSKNISKNGYENISLKDANNKQNTKLVHRMVARAFLGLSHNLQVNHINGNKLDNRIENLEYSTCKQNLEHAKSLRLIPVGSNKPNSKLKENDIATIRNLFQTGKYKQKEIAKIYNIDASCISRILNRLVWRHI